MVAVSIFHEIISVRDELIVKLGITAVVVVD